MERAAVCASAVTGLAVLAPRRAAADGASGPRTAVIDFDGRTAVLKTAPIPSVALAHGARLAVCLVAGGGAQGAGPAPAIERLEVAEISGVGVLDPDRGVESSVYRMLAGFDTVRPVELFGLSAKLPTALEAGQPLELSWRVVLQGQATVQDLERYLDGYHSFVVGEVSSSGTFRGHVQFMEISRAPDEGPSRRHLDREP